MLLENIDVHCCRGFAFETLRLTAKRRKTSCANSWEDIMTVWQSAASRWNTAKPVVFALVIGLIAGPFISSFAGWQGTAGTARAQLRDGVVEQQASFCNAQARSEVQDPGKLGWSAQRDLAGKWAVMPGATSAESDVTSAC